MRADLDHLVTLLDGVLIALKYDDKPLQVAGRLLGKLESVTWKDKTTGQTSEHEIRHVFIMAGASPRTEWLNGCLALDDKGFILTGRDLDLSVTLPPDRGLFVKPKPQPVFVIPASPQCITLARSAATTSTRWSLLKVRRWQNAFTTLAG